MEQLESYNEIISSNAKMETCSEEWKIVHLFQLKMNDIFRNFYIYLYTLSFWVFYIVNKSNQKAEKNSKKKQKQFIIFFPKKNNSLKLHYIALLIVFDK